MNIGDTIRIPFTNPKTKNVIVGLGFVTEKENLNSQELGDEGFKIFEYGIFILKCGDKKNFFTNAYSGSFCSSRVLLLEKYSYNSNNILKKIPIKDKHLIREIGE